MTRQEELARKVALRRQDVENAAVRLHAMKAALEAAKQAMLADRCGMGQGDLISNAESGECALLVRLEEEKLGAVFIYVRRLKKDGIPQKAERYAGPAEQWKFVERKADTAPTGYVEA